MMVNGGTCGIYLTCIQCYGGGVPDSPGGLGLWPEYDADVGHPVGEPMLNAESGVWSRAYSKGLALVNPTAKRATFTAAAGTKCNDLYGKERGSAMQLKPGSGLVLLRA